MSEILSVKNLLDGYLLLMNSYILVIFKATNSIFTIYKSYYIDIIYSY
ncbi:Uncharacterised protein [Staphylococcus saccharolyticus]|uniref:Uncharacterized protein n=1 Tax=Staphylococcus saccharolyticus TaxID=33028 RepID=A0A380H6U5_9STAP|nr:Uncharacterised protein [Staphylococcus saccharolyticus]